MPATMPGGMFFRTHRRNFVYVSPLFFTGPFTVKRPFDSRYLFTNNADDTGADPWSDRSNTFVFAPTIFRSSPTASSMLMYQSRNTLEYGESGLSMYFQKS